MRKPARYFSLRHPKLRQSWNKTNLYNLARNVGDEPPMVGNKTLFQQRWAAKSKTRGYHGEHLTEKNWVRIFDRRLNSAVNIPPKYLARHDGSEQAAGRGSGLSTNPVSADDFAPRDSAPPLRRPPLRNIGRRTSLLNTRMLDAVKDMTPYMQMTFAPLERRLDTAIYRAMFASSVRQARQFVIHGAVKVNGQKMRHPSYNLNPGDMFQVDIEKVLYATGKQKESWEVKELEIAAEKRAKSEAKARKAAFEEATGGRKAAGEGEGEETEIKAEDLTPEERWKLRNKELKSVIKHVQYLLKDNTGMNAKKKQKLRLFRQSAKRFLSRPPEEDVAANELIEELQMQMKSLEIEGESLGLLGQEEAAQEEAAVETEAEAKAEDQAEVEADSGEPKLNRAQEINKGLEGLTEEQKQKALEIMGDEKLTRAEMRSLVKVLQYDAENPLDESKPYKTPWEPRQFMQAFAYIPRYLEVNPYICSAIYLRHPVARKGHAEVPTPFNYYTNQLAHSWYLGRGPTWRG